MIRRGKYSFKNDNLFKKKGKEIIQKYKKGESMISLGEKYNVNRKIIQRYLKKNKVKLRTQAEASGGISTDNYEEICRKYLKGDTTTSIAKHFNLGYDEICNILNRCGVEIRDKRIRHIKIPLRFHDEICRRYQNGETTYQLHNDYSKKLGISLTSIRSVLLHYKVELRGSSHPYDTITHAINGTGSFIKQRECEFYVYGIKNYPEYLKVGISFNSEARANDDSWAYDLENKLLVIELNSREEAFFLEQAILKETSKKFKYPLFLAEKDFGGLFEVRKMSFKDLDYVINFYLEELENIGTWNFAIKYLKMTNNQRMQCLDKNKKYE